MFTVIQIDRPDIVTTEMKKLSLSSQEPFTLFNKISAALFVYIIVPTGSVNEINLSSVVLGIVIVLVLYCLSAVFKYGCSLQKEVDGML